MPGGTAGVGVFLRPFLSVRADALFEGESKQQFPLSILTGVLVDLPGLGRPGDLPITLPAAQSARTRTNSVQTLIAYHLESSSRFRLRALQRSRPAARGPGPP